MICWRQELVIYSDSELPKALKVRLRDQLRQRIATTPGFQLI
jgi:hypothetical protein